MTIRSMPCTACPYRQDVPSGLWAVHEYEKLRDYDLPTPDQPMATFFCHATPEHVCHGWAVVHSNRGHEHDLLALRMWPHGDVPDPGVPLFSSGNEAADHGQADIEEPSLDATQAIQHLLSQARPATRSVGGRAVASPHGNRPRVVTLRMGGYRYRDDAERIERNTERDGDCLVWTSTRRPDGYGVVNVRGRVVRAHRLAWEIVHGPIPDGLDVLHGCDNPPCCAIEHLRLGSDQDNTDDKMERGRQRKPWTERTHCVNGHALTDDNVYHPPKRPTHRHCRICLAERDRNRRS